MTQSEQIIASIYQKSCELIWESFLVAADAAQDLDQLDRAEALRWLAENKRMPLPSHHPAVQNKSGWGWHFLTGVYDCTSLANLSNEAKRHSITNEFYPTFEAAIEAFIAAWPKIKPKQMTEDEINQCLNESQPMLIYGE